MFTRTQTINKQIHVIKQTFKFNFIKNEMEYEKILLSIPDLFFHIESPPPLVDCTMRNAI